MKKGLVCLVVLAPLLISPPSFPQQRGGRGQAAIVIRDDAPVYPTARSMETAWRLKREDAVAGATLDLGRYQPLFDEKDGRVRIIYFRGEQKGVERGGWMDPADLARFYYDGSCSAWGGPLVAKGMSMRWNGCFQEARDAKLEELRKKWAEEAATTGAPKASDENRQTPDAPADPNGSQ